MTGIDEGFAETLEAQIADLRSWAEDAMTAALTFEQARVHSQLAADDPVSVMGEMLLVASVCMGEASARLDVFGQLVAAHPPGEAMP